MRLLGIDYGEKRVGVASTDESGEFALPRQVLQNGERLLDEVQKLADEFKAERIILGESRDLKGEPNKIHAEAQRFAEELRGRGWEVVFHPEFFTSQQAERLQGRNDMLDASAAALILKSYIDSNRP